MNLPGSASSVQRQSRWMSYCLIQECSRAGRALPHQNAPGASSACQSIIRAPAPLAASPKPAFLFDRATLLSRSDLALPKLRRAAEGIGRSGATRSHAQRAVAREHGEDGEHRTFPEVSTVAHSRRSRIGRPRHPLRSVTSRNRRHTCCVSGVERCLPRHLSRSCHPKHHFMCQRVPPRFHPAL